MIVYRSNKKEFVENVFNNTIADNIDDAFMEHLGRHTSRNEKLSWKNSMMYMSNVVNTNEIPDDSTIAIEYQIPLTSKRVDFIIAGNDIKQEPNVVIVELKQWEHVKLSGKDAIVQTRFQHGEAETAHPSYQAWSYAFMLHNYNQTIREEHIKLNPCAYLHNYTDDGIISNKIYQEYIDKAPLFFKTDTANLQNFIKKHIKYGDKNNILYRIENGRLKPSKQLADALSSMLNGNQEFLLLDEQKVIYETALHLAKESQRNKKNVYIVEGGPGTGKSVLAINLLVQLTNQEMFVKYVSKNAAPRDVYTAKLRGHFRVNFINNLFVGSGCFTDCQKNSFDTLIVDEAHRLNLKSGFYGTDGENQIKEIINAAKFSVFFVDDRQRIHVKDIGSKAYIEQCAKECGAEIHHAHLKSQFRCNGSDGYLSWIDNTLQIRETANINLTTEDFDFKIFSDPNDLYDTIVEKNQANNKARLVAGYCWDWNSKKNPLDYDIQIPEYNFKKRWNLKNDGNQWIIGQESVTEIGCIHTCQGLELDYIGVILGPDIRYKNGQIVTDVRCRSSNDQSVKGLRTHADEPYVQEEADILIKNTYRTLMTRGMKGCYIYCCDKELEKYIQSKLRAADVKAEHKNSIRIEETVNDECKYIDFLPIYSMKAACGYFGDGEIIDESGWVRAEGVGKLNRNMFIVEAKGHSMEPLIHDGDFCVFRANPAGSRQDKIVLVEHRNHTDADYIGSYSIKRYTSKKSYDKYGNWKHEEIVLMPQNKDYSPIVILEEEADEFRIIGEYVGTI